MIEAYFIEILRYNLNKIVIIIVYTKFLDGMKGLHQINKVSKKKNIMMLICIVLKKIRHTLHYNIIFMIIGGISRTYNAPTSSPISPYISTRLI